jgi:DNA polymerase-4
MTDFLGGNPLRYLFLDFNSYFASVEQQENPALRGKPVAVVPVMSDTTCAIAASYEAKAFGIRTGTGIREAKERCPGLILVPARHDVYVRYHHRLIEEVDRHIPVHKVWSVDEMACKLDRSEHNPQTAAALAKRIKQGIAERVGESLTCSIGIAPSSLLAKIATDLEKPDGLVILQDSDLPGPLLSLKVTDLPGIGQRMARRLAEAGIDTVDGLWKLAPRHARAIWGGVGGERFWYELHGFDVPHLPTNRSIIGHSRVLDPQSRTPREARLVARTLVMKAAFRLRHAGLAAGGLLLAGDKWQKGWASHVRFSPTQDSFVLLKWLDELWPGLLRAAGRDPKFRHVQIGLFDFVDVNGRQPDMFAAGDGGGESLSRGERLCHIIDKLNATYGRDTITLASQLGQKLHYAGAKIAFNRVPDPVEFDQTLIETADANGMAVQHRKAIKHRRSVGWGRQYEPALLPG